MLDPFLTEKIYNMVHNMQMKEVNASIVQFFERINGHSGYIMPLKHNYPEVKKLRCRRKNITADDKAYWRLLSKRRKEIYGDLESYGFLYNLWCFDPRNNITRL
jgi:hypothetical protein